jgi:regulator of protease activity HflC (stomatin/prohibitin superfamily)
VLLVPLVVIAIFILTSTVKILREYERAVVFNLWRFRGVRNATPGNIIEAVRKLVLIVGDDLIAGILNRNELTTGNGNRWTRERVTA